MVSLTFAPIADAGYVNVYGLDITERKRAETEMRRLNEELEAFSYSVSHDLRGPLRSMDGFSEILLEDYGSQLDATGRDSLERIRTASRRMAQLIDDLLNLSRVSRQQMRRRKVDLSALVREITTELQEPRLEFVIADDVSVDGDPALLRVLLENLLANAVKFTSKHPRARIEFGLAQVDSEPAYFVRDDGAGFNMDYASKLFGPFQRLHSEAEFPGMGIGLATARRIVQRHGGRIWAEGNVEAGATFYFTL